MEDEIKLPKREDDLKISKVKYQQMVGSVSNFKLKLRGPNQSVQKQRWALMNGNLKWHKMKYDLKRNLNISATNGQIFFKLKLIGPN